MTVLHSGIATIATTIPTDSRTSKGDIEIGNLMRACLWRSPYPALRRLHCEFRKGHAVLRGKVNSFYLKQVAQEAIRKLPGIRHVSNMIEVT